MTGSHMNEDLMTRRQVAVMFRVTSAAVATWARRGRLPEVRNEAGRPRYRREDVEALFRSGLAVKGAVTGNVAGRRASP
jgi:predicted site-specific integrase-resolvase